MPNQFIPASTVAAYLAQLPAAAQQRATEYTHGNHWIVLFSALVGVAINLVLVRWNGLERLRQRRAQAGARPQITVLLLFFTYYCAAWLLDLPWALYAKWWREVRYGLGHQGVSAWLTESLVSAVFSAVALGLVMLALYALIRRAPRTWWLWSSAVTAAMIVFVIVIVPVTLAPMFNDYTPLAAGPQRDAVVALAREAGIAPDRIVTYDGSKQSANYTANVTGLFGSARIAISDALLNQADDRELRAVVGHEIGHFVLHHELYLAFGYAALLTFGFWITHLLYRPLAAMVGAPQLADIANPAGLPLLSLLLTVLFLLLTPVTNGMMRFAENQADVYSLAHAREPDGMAIALLRTADYRAPDPGAVEEWLFYDHPSIARRIQRTLDWKAQHPAR